MSWRVLHIGSQSYLRIENRNLVIDRDQPLRIPVEDIACLILESPQITLTTSVLQCAAEYGWCIFSCDASQLPNGVFTSYQGHSRQFESLQRQLNWKRSFRDRLWQRIVSQKINNQAQCLTKFEHSSGSRRLKALASRVKSGDSTFCESRAARLYFTELFGKEFERRPEIADRVNSALNYGYAILRGCIARTICGYGFLPALGIQHHGPQNAFNLADDMIEPFRPICDTLIRLKFFKGNADTRSGLDSEDKRVLLGLLESDVLIENQSFGMLSAIDAVIASLVGATKTNRPGAIKLPELLPEVSPHGRENETLDANSGLFRPTDDQ
jgi:CRISP-associated protein Cas1